MKHLFQLTPHYPPLVCGVGDHAWLLTKALEENHGIKNTVLVSNQKPQPEQSLSSTSSTAFFSPSSDFVNFFKDIHRPADALLLQFSGYGYHSKGLAFWLLDFLKAFRVNYPHAVVLTMYHELFIKSSWYKRTYPLALAQRSLARRIANISDGIRTNREVSAKWLRSILPASQEVRSMPVFSNMGENEGYIPLEDRSDELLLFQAPDAGNSANEGFWRELHRVTEIIKPNKIIIAGRLSHLPADMKAPVELRGPVTAEECSTLFSQCRWFYFDYEPGALAKSGIFATAAAHGIACILARENDSSEDGLLEGRQYWLSEKITKNTSLTAAESVARGLFNWYQPHNLKSTAGDVCDQLLQMQNNRS